QGKREHDRDGTLEGRRGPATRWGGIGGHGDHLTTRPVTIRTARVCPPIPAATLTWLKQAAVASAAERACTCADATGASRRRPQCLAGETGRAGPRRGGLRPGPDGAPAISPAAGGNPATRRCSCR